MLGVVDTFLPLDRVLLLLLPPPLLLLLQRPPLPPPPPPFSLPAFAVNSARICCISVFGLVMTGVGCWRLVMAARMVCISVGGALAAGAGVGADDWFSWRVLTTRARSVNALSYVTLRSMRLLV